jgi:hypothetical protein
MSAASRGPAGAVCGKVRRDSFIGNNPAGVVVRKNKRKGVYCVGLVLKIFPEWNRPDR